MVGFNPSPLWLVPFPNLCTPPGARKGCSNIYYLHYRINSPTLLLDRNRRNIAWGVLCTYDTIVDCGLLNSLLLVCICWG